MQRRTPVDYLLWILAIFIAVVFVQSLFFKFSNSFETRYIFTTIGNWLADIGLPVTLAGGFAASGGYAVGTVELIAAILLLMPRTRRVGAFVALGVMSGALFFHLFTPLGVSVVIEESGTRDGGQLFALAVGVFVAALLILWLGRRRVEP